MSITKYDVILNNTNELHNGRQWILDCSCEAIDFEEAVEMTDNMSNLDIAKFINKNWNNGIEGWLSRGELEYR